MWCGGGEEEKVRDGRSKDEGGKRKSSIKGNPSKADRWWLG
jgi:hypothetical protein